MTTRIVALSFCALTLFAARAQELATDHLRRTVWEVETSLGTCNAVLLNNHDSDGRQLLLTARHCLRGESDFVSVRLSDRLLNDSDIRELAWSSRNLTLLNASADLDYVLYEINDPIPPEMLPAYAGWNRSSVQPRTLTGWHSLLEEKSQSLDLNRPAYQTLPELAENQGTPPVNGTWRVLHWEAGYTDVGSSGSPVFNQWGQVVGVLSAGGSSPEDPSNDLYARFDLMAEEISEHLGDSGPDHCHGLDWQKSINDLQKESAFHRADVLRDLPEASVFTEWLSLPTSNIEGLYLPIADAGRDDLLEISIVDDRGGVVFDTTWSTRARLFGREHYLPVVPPRSVSAGEYAISIRGSETFRMYRAITDGGRIAVDNGEQTGHSLLMSLLISGGSALEEAELSQNVSIYPNPVRDNLFVEGLTDKSMVDLINSHGQRVKAPTTLDLEGRYLIDFQGLPFGVYFLQTGEGGTFPILHR